MSVPSFFELQVAEAQPVATLWLNRPDKGNLMNTAFWDGLPHAVAELEGHKHLRAVVVAAKGNDFSWGLDLKDFFMNMGQTLQEANTAEGREVLRDKILHMQRGLDAISQSPLPFIAAIHGKCIGAGLDLAAACDLRLASQEASFSLREARVGIVADMGSLNRLPAIIGQGNTRLLAYTGRDISAQEAHRMHLVNELYDSPEALQEGAQALANEIAEASPIAVRGSKRVLSYVASHPDERDSLEYVATWNAAFLTSKDLSEAMAAFLEKRAPKF